MDVYLENWLNLLNKLDKKSHSEEYTICSCNKGSLMICGESDYQFTGNCSLQRVCAIVQLDRYQSSVLLSVDKMVFKTNPKEI